MRMIDLIAAKRDGARHTPEEIRFIVAGAASGSLPDYQLSAWLMAVCCRGMSDAETVALTREMAASGASLEFKALGPKVDKHSTGGVGDGISLALAPLVASAGLVVPMMSGRGLGHTGGTLDKLEAISGFRVRLGLDEIVRQLSRNGVCMFGQSETLAPADRKLYQLRDVTATVESLPLVVGSILSKKLAEGLDALVLDVKVGSGAIFQETRRAAQLARALVKTSRLLGVKAVALLTAMEQPLGRYVGNALEVRQAVEVLQGDCSAGDYVECLLALGGWMLRLGGKARTEEEGARILEARIRDGRAIESFKLMVAAQGGDPRVADNLDLLPKAAASKMAASPKSGYLSRLDARKIGEAAVILGAGRAFLEQKLDYGAGIILDKKVGDSVKKGESVARLYGSDQAKIEEAHAVVQAALAVDAKPPKRRPVVIRVLQ